MIFGVGLPRCAGQTLQTALTILTGKRFWHSIAAERWHDSITADDGGAVEVHVPIRWIDATFSGPHKYIVNTRDLGSWFKSCQKVYDKAQQLDWKNPMWRQPLGALPDYKIDYEQITYDNLDEMGVDYITVDFIKHPRWKELCEFLDLPIPDQPFPNRDLHGRPKAPLISNDPYRINFPIGPRNPLEAF